MIFRARHLCLMAEWAELTEWAIEMADLLWVNVFSERCYNPMAY